MRKGSTKTKKAMISNKLYLPEADILIDPDAFWAVEKGNIYIQFYRYNGECFFTYYENKTKRDNDFQKVVSFCTETEDTRNMFYGARRYSTS